jgi:hypothetical protein
MKPNVAFVDGGGGDGDLIHHNETPRKRKRISKVASVEFARKSPRFQVINQNEEQQHQQNPPPQLHILPKVEKTDDGDGDEGNRTADDVVSDSAQNGNFESHLELEDENIHFEIRNADDDEGTNDNWDVVEQGLFAIFVLNNKFNSGYKKESIIF